MDMCAFFFIAPKKKGRDIERGIKGRGRINRQTEPKE